MLAGHQVEGGAEVLALAHRLGPARQGVVVLLAPSHAFVVAAGGQLDCAAEGALDACSEGLGAELAGHVEAELGAPEPESVLLGEHVRDELDPGVGRVLLRRVLLAVASRLARRAHAVH